jgi:hypothetical protein
VLDARRNAIAANIARTMDAKRKGNSVDFVQALGRDDDLKIDVIGASMQALSIELPARHVLEQILAKFRIPSWMLGFQWNTSDRASDGQVEMALGAAKVRWEARRPYLNRLIATLLRLRGRSWSPGDWALVQETPNLRDVVKNAQADFLRAQTAMMLASAGVMVDTDSVAIPGMDPNGGGQPKRLTAAQVKAVFDAVESAGARAAQDIAAIIDAQLANLPRAA